VTDSDKTLAYYRNINYCGRIKFYCTGSWSKFIALSFNHNSTTFLSHKLHCLFSSEIVRGGAGSFVTTFNRLAFGQLYCLAICRRSVFCESIAEIKYACADQRWYWQRAIFKNVMLTKLQVINVMLTKCHVDKMPCWQNVMLTKYHVDKMKC
jgi:hypothetical protein